MTVVQKLENFTGLANDLKTLHQSITKKLPRKLKDCDKRILEKISYSSKFVVHIQILYKSIMKREKQQLGNSRR